MTNFSNRMAATLLALATLAVVVAAPAVSRAQGAGVDPEAVKLLRRMTDYLGSLKQFSVHTQTTLEDSLASGHRVDFDVSASVIISRPNKLRAESKGDLIDQIFYYDGTTLTLPPQVAPPHRSAAWSTTTVALTSIVRRFRGTTWCM